MYTYWLQIARGLSSTVVLLLLVACGGGGGGGGGNSSLQYSGNTNAAVVTTRNTAKLAANIFGGDTSTVNSGVIGVSTENTGAPQPGNAGLTTLTQHLNGSFRDALVRANRAGVSQPATLSGASVNDTQPCDSGSVHTTGTINDNSGTGTLTLSFNNCRTGDETLGGQATVRVDAFDFVFFLPTDYTVSFGRLTIRGTGVSIDTGGASHVQSNIGGNAETITDNLVSLNNFTHGMTKTENLVFMNTYDNILFPSSYTSTLSGRVFDSVLGYVDLATNASFAFGSLTQLFPQTGQMSITGNVSSNIRVTATSATLAKLELDLDGNTVFENTAILKWTDLAGPVGSDLGDDDHDGMHNSWEVANGLNPLDPADATLNNDGDSLDNLNEYLGGTNPNISGS